MEDVLDVYQRPHDPAQPLVCQDEASKQLLGEVREPLPLQPGAPCRQDCEYECHGTANMFISTRRWRAGAMSMSQKRRTAVDFARVVKDLVDVHFPQALRIVLVMDNLNTMGRPPCTRPSPRLRHGAWRSSWKSTTRPSTAAG